ncbi:MAG: glycosyltransferase family 4 protein [Nitrospira sp.]|nr:glycosyltransferase family 4 protein [Nitrospira sp.]
MQQDIGISGSPHSDNSVRHGLASPSEDGRWGLQKVPSSGSLNSIAICTVGELFGGVERQVLGLITGLAARGVSTLLVLFHDSELAAQARLQGVEPVILSDRNRSVFTTSRQLARLFRHRNIHVVHVHGYKATVFCALARRWCSFAMVKTEHGLPESTVAGVIHTLRNRFYSFLESAATRVAHATVSYVTKDLQEHYRQAHFGLRTTVIPNGVATMNRSQFPCPAEIDKGLFNIAMVGRLDIVKGPHTAIETIASRGIPQNVHLYIIGTGPCEIELQALAEARGIANRIHLLGFRRNVYDYLAHCNVLLMPSLHEGLPYTLLEAMALGIPIVASRVGGLAEVVLNETTGLLVPPRNAEAFAQSICRLYEDSLLRSEMGSQARSLQQAKYSLEAMTEKYLAIYQHLMTRTS